MAKRILAYRGYTGPDLKTRATVPDAADITTTAGYADCVNISTTKISDALGLAEPISGVVALCRHADVNPWSAFGPTVRTVQAGVLTNSLPTTCRLGDFAGYNHTAAEPSFMVGGVDISHVQQAGTSYSFYCKVDIGELIYTDLGVTHVAFSIWEGTTYIDSRVKAISSMTNVADFYTNLADRMLVSGINFTTTYTCKIEFLDSATYNYLGSNTVCRLNELANWTVEIQVKSLNHFYLSSQENNPLKYGTTFTSGKWDVNIANFNTTDGTITIYYIKLNSLLGGGYNHVHVGAYVEEGYFDEHNLWQGTKLTGNYTYLYDGTWNQSIGDMIQILTPVDIWDIGDPINTSGYGYRIVIFCNLFSL